MIFCEHFENLRSSTFRYTNHGIPFERDWNLIRCWLSNFITQILEIRINSWIVQKWHQRWSARTPQRNFVNIAPLFVSFVYLWFSLTTWRIKSWNQKSLKKKKKFLLVKLYILNCVEVIFLLVWSRRVA